MGSSPTGVVYNKQHNYEDKMFGNRHLVLAKARLEQENEALRKKLEKVDFWLGLGSLPNLHIKWRMSEDTAFLGTEPEYGVFIRRQIPAYLIYPLQSYAFRDELIRDAMRVSVKWPYECGCQPSINLYPNPEEWSMNYNRVTAAHFAPDENSWNKADLIIQTWWKINEERIMACPECDAYGKLIEK